MPEKKLRIVNLRIDNRSFVVGQKGVVGIEVNPPLAAVHYEDKVLFFSDQRGLIEWCGEIVEEPLVQIPQIVPPDNIRDISGQKKAQ